MTVFEVTESFGTLKPAERRAQLYSLPDDVRMIRTPEVLVIVRWDDVRALLRDKRFAGVGLSIFDLLGIDDGPLRRWYGSLMFTNEGETHSRLRSLVQLAFVPRSIEALRGETAAIADELLAGVVAAGEGDLVDLASELPIRAMGRLLGIPDADIVEFTGWSKALGPVFGFMSEEQIVAATESIEAILEYTGSLLDRRRDDPQDDLITRLLHAEIDGERLSAAEVVDMVVNLVVGGHDTSTGQIACTLLTLLEHPEVIAALRADPALVPLAVEETLRHNPAIGAIPRVALVDVDYDGLHIPAGSVVVLSSDGANHDPAGYPEPFRFLPARFDAEDAQRLMTFGGGPHFCLGAAMARMVVQEAVAAVLRLPKPVDLTVDPAEIEWVSVLAAYPGRVPIRCAS